MSQKFKIGERVTRNSEAGHVSGTIVKIHKSDFDYKGYTHHASKEGPQYEIKSDKTEHVAVHKASALSKKRKLVKQIK
ncbi:MAG TPA: DUF2945 domain-containing protein [Ginsengibacter sp.]|nr:DUF2945 domain-containing protein [Ginsengibacter sp.]